MIGKDIGYEQTQIGAGDQEVRYGDRQNSRLPDTSDIQGKITGIQVHFTKTYRGATEITWTVGEKQIASFRGRHQVQ